MENREFEFQMCKTSLEKNAITISPADELFYKGKLLPLHLPPRLQMLQNLLQKSNTNSPMESCSISPTDSCRVSCEINPDEYFFPWSTGVSDLPGGGCDSDAHLSKKPWSKKMKLIKKSALTQKLKFSRDYMKSFFTKPAACTVEAKMDEDEQIGFTCHRLSFSGGVKRNSTSKKDSSSTTTTSNASSNCSCSSSSFSLKSTDGFYEINLLKNGVNTEDDNSIEGAIAHCKKSQQKLAANDASIH